MDKSANPQHLEEIPPVSASSTPAIATKQARARKGKGARSNQAEQFRVKKNQQFQQGLDRKLEEFRVQLGYSSADILGQRNLNPQIHPQHEIEVDISTIVELCHDTAEVLHTACKVPPSPNTDQAIDYDAETLLWAASLQIETKIFNARLQSNFLPDIRFERLATRVNKLLGNALLPITVFIDQIGKFPLNDQVFIPKISGDGDFTYTGLAQPQNPARAMIQGLANSDPVGTPTQAVGPRGGIMYVSIIPGREIHAVAAGLVALRPGGNQESPEDYELTADFLQNPLSFNYFGIASFVEAVGAPQPQFDQVVQRYVELMGRVDKKLRDAYASLSLTSGRGTESQLVYTTPMTNEISSVVAWSPRNVMDDSMIMGAVLKLGELDQPYGDRRIAYSECVIDVSAGITQLANVLTKRLK